MKAKSPITGGFCSLIGNCLKFSVREQKQKGIINKVWILFFIKESRERKKREYCYEKLESNIGYCFKDKDLLINALTHTSYANEHKA